jgi:hypothetical protein
MMPLDVPGAEVSICTEASAGKYNYKLLNTSTLNIAKELSCIETVIKYNVCYIHGRWSAASCG